MEQITARSYPAEAERRLITPLRLTDTSSPGARASLPLPHGRAYTADGADVTDRLREMLDTRAAHGAYGMGLFPVKLPCGTTVWGQNGRISGSYVRSAATVGGRRVLTFRVNTGGVTDPALEPAVLAAEFCPRTP